MPRGVDNFLGLLRINTASAHGFATGTYKICVEFLQRICQDAGLETEVWEGIKGKPVLIATWKGKNPTLSSILFTGHYDVVPVDLDKWSVDPWQATIKQGRIYARGSQDMKCCLAAYIEAAHQLKEEGFQPERTIHFTFVPDEEIGGHEGMALFVESRRFEAMNVGFAIDEGLASPTETVPVFFGERTIWWIMLKSCGATSHASRFLTDNGAVEKLLRACNDISDFRKTQLEKHVVGGAKLGEIVSINVSALKAGHTSDHGETFALNVIPTEASAGVDIRIPPFVKLQEFEEHYLKKWTREEGVSYEKIHGANENALTSIDPQENKWWKSFVDICQEIGIKITPEIFPAATDSRFLRQKGIPCLGFTPIPHTPILLHDHDEYLEIEIFVNAISVYRYLMKSLALL